MTGAEVAVVIGAAQLKAIAPSWAASWMLRTAPTIKTGDAGGGSSTVNVQVAFCSATATAFPAWPGESNTTRGQSKVLPLTHGGMSLTIRMPARLLSSAAR